MKKIIRLTESDLRNIVKESVKKIIKEASIYPGYNSTSTQGMAPINNKNYEYDPSTLTGVDKTMGYAQKFKYNGDDPEWFRETLRKSDGDDFNPDWMENAGVDFEGDTAFDIDSLYNSITEKLISVGVKDVTEAYKNVYQNAYDGGNYDDEEYDAVNPEVVKHFLSASGEQRLHKQGYVYNWFIELGDRTFCSRHNFDDEDIAQENCDKYIKLINKLGGSCEARVDGISLENGKYIMDTCLAYENFGDGEPFWMD